MSACWPPCKGCWRPWCSRRSQRAERCQALSGQRNVMSQARAKTIQIFLPSGDPQGIRQAEITTRIVRLLEVPRALLKDFLAMPESAGGAVYFLFGDADESAKPH